MKHSPIDCFHSITPPFYWMGKFCLATPPPTGRRKKKKRGENTERGVTTEQRAVEGEEEQTTERRGASKLHHNNTTPPNPSSTAPHPSVLNRVQILYIHRPGLANFHSCHTFSTDSTSPRRGWGEDIPAPLHIG